MQLEFPERQFKELCFHLRELRLDLGASIKECKSLLSISPEHINASETTQLILRVRYDFENLIVRIEHIITSHLSQSLRIVGKVLSNSSLIEIGENLASFETDWNEDINNKSDNVQIKTLAEIYVNLHITFLKFDSVLNQVNHLVLRQIDKGQSYYKLGEALRKIADVVFSQIHPQIVEIYFQSFQLHYTLDPEIAKQDEDWNLLATPLREENHPLARSIGFCPNCGASLTSDDRTFNGSYCENCRTRWIQSA